jgi:drug/metabolite transporter superfamily protein YnfA
VYSLQCSLTMNALSQIQDTAVSWFNARRVIEVAVMLAAAVFEVGGDAMIRAGMRSHGWLLAGLGVATLGAYGIVVNLLTSIDFSKLLATYVAFFAIVSVLFGRVLFAEKVAGSTWAGLGVILLGSAIVQLGMTGR